MANTTIYPYGTNGQLPSSIGVINDLTTGGADKALSAEMGKELNEFLKGSTTTKSSSSTYNKYYVITDNVLDKDNPVSSSSSAQVNSTIIDVVAGQKVTWTAGNYQIAAVHKFTFAACDNGDNVLFSSTKGSGEYTVVEDGYIVVQGWRDYSVTIVQEGLVDEVEALQGNVVDNLTTDDATKALSAKQGKKLGDDIYGYVQSYEQTNANGLHSISDNVLNPETTSQSYAGSIMVPVQAGQVVSYGPLNPYNVGNVLIVTDEQYNVLYKLSNSNLSAPYSGTYTITEDGYVVVQGWCYWGSTPNTIPVTIRTLGIVEVIGTKVDSSDVSNAASAAVAAAISTSVNPQIDAIKYTDNIVPIIGWSQKTALSSSGAFSTSIYGDVSDFVEIPPSTKMLVTAVSNGTSGSKEDPLICFYSRPETRGFISKVAADSISATGTEVTAPSNARYFRLNFAHRHNYPYGQNVYSVQLEIKSFLAGLSDARDKEWYFNLPAYVDGVSGAPATVFCEQFMSGVDDFLIRGANNSSAQTFITEHGEKAIRFPNTGDNAILICRKNTVNEPAYGIIIQTVSNTTGSFHKVVKSRINSRSVGDGTESKNILFIGDSLMAGNNPVSQTETGRLLNEDADYTFNLMTEATQGWSYNDHLTNSKFLNNGVLDFQHYMETYHASIASGGIDYVIINLGTNDIRSYSIDTIVANAKTLIDAILDETTGYPNAKIAIGLPALGAPFDDKEDFAFGSAKTFKMGMLGLNARLISEFDNGVYNSNVTTMAHGAYIYGWEGYTHEDVAVNGYSETTMRRFNSTPNGTTIHPSNIGYKQWGFAYYCKIRAFIAGNL